MKRSISRIPRPARLGLFAFVLTVVTGGIWSVLVVINLHTTRGVPWAVAPMAVLLWAVWRYLTGAWGRHGTAETRRSLARATTVRRGVWSCSVLAGALAVAALAGLWIVLSQVARIPGSSLQDISGYPVITVVPLLIMASLVSSSAEEIGFRGYFQGPLESRLGGTAAIAVMIVVIAPAHAITQGFVWPVVVFYLLADAMFGWLARLTGSVLPGFVVHSLGLFIFFTLIWPGDRSRVLVSAGGTNIWFWIHVGQIFLAIPAILVFMRLARLTAENRQTGPG